MPVFNSERFLAEAIESIRRQTFTDFEFLIVDDGSTDGSLTIIRDYAKRDPRIRVFQHAENRGQGAALNTGMARVAGNFVTGMDSDDVSLPQRLETQVNFLDARPDIGAVGVSHQNCHEDMTPYATHLLPTSHHIITFHFILFTRTVMKSATMMVRRSFLDFSPAFDPDIVFGRDVDHFLRLIWDKGIRYENLPERLYLYRRHDGSQGRQLTKIMPESPKHVRCRALRRLGERGRGAEWIVHKHPLNKLSWRERRRARRDIARLIEAMVEHNWVDAGDEHLLLAEMKQLVESTSPRYWQMFLHWYRYRFARHFYRRA